MSICQSHGIRNLGKPGQPRSHHVARLFFLSQPKTETLEQHRGYTFDNRLVPIRQNATPVQNHTTGLCDLWVGGACFSWLSCLPGSAWLFLAAKLVDNDHPI